MIIGLIALVFIVGVVTGSILSDKCDGYNSRTAIKQEVIDGGSRLTIDFTDKNEWYNYLFIGSNGKMYECTDINAGVMKKMTILRKIKLFIL